MSSLLPPPKFAVTYVDAFGYTKPAVGWKLFSYAAGTSTPKSTFTDAGLGTPNANPTILDARGEASIRLDGAYKIVLKTDADVTVYTEDQVVDLTSSGVLANVNLSGTMTVTSTAVTWSGNPTHSGNHTWTGNHLFNGNVTLGDAAADALTVNPNAVTWAGNPTHSGNHTFSGTMSVAGQLSTTAGLTAGNVARAGAAVFDWYEEGVFTPVLSFAGATTGITYFSQSGRYVRIGRLVHITIRLGLSSKGSASGVASIEGLPFVAHATQQLMNCHLYGMTGLTAPAIIMTNPSSTNLLPSTTVLATGSPSSADNTVFTNTSVVYVNSVYEVA